MSVNGGGGRIRGGSSSERRNGSLAGMNEATTGGKGSGPYSHGIQVIDENKEFTYVLPSAPNSIPFTFWGFALPRDNPCGGSFSFGEGLGD